MWKHEFLVVLDALCVRLKNWLVLPRVCRMHEASFWWLNAVKNLAQMIGLLHLHTKPLLCLHAFLLEITVNGRVVFISARSMSTTVHFLLKWVVTCHDCLVVISSLPAPLAHFLVIASVRAIIELNMFRHRATVPAYLALFSCGNYHLRCIPHILLLNFDVLTCVI